MASPTFMPPSNKKTVLVTGVNGYIASNLALHLLQHGYTVRGTSRNPGAGPYLLATAFAGYESRYSHSVVPDITAPGAFDAAVVGVHAIMHTASPVDFTLQTVDAFMIPAVQGNLSLLNSALARAGDQLKNFVLTSSNSAVIDRWRQPPGYEYTEADWNTSGEAVARKSEVEGPFLSLAAYGASKAAAERAMWDFVEKKSPSFSCSAVNPAVVTGPPVSFPTTPERLNETLKPIWDIFTGGPIPPGLGTSFYIDVRDVCWMHQWCIEHPAEARGQRYLMTNGKAPPQAVADVLRKQYPERGIEVGEPGLGYRGEDFWFLDEEVKMVANKAYTALGVEKRGFIRFDRSVLDTVEVFERVWGERIGNQKKK